jgi:hypothetical protein
MAVSYRAELEPRNWELASGDRSSGGKLAARDTADPLPRKMKLRLLTGARMSSPEFGALRLQCQAGPA